jgi:adenylate cyclase
VRDTVKVTRRLAAILAADIAGYSRLMGEDEAATVRALKGHQTEVLPMVAEYNGRIIDTAGDGILAEFASVIDAVECALDIQATMYRRNQAEVASRRMQFRIGINLGDVIHDEVRIYGDGINVAARLEGIAQPGGICISAKVHAEVNDKLKLEFLDLGEQWLKNIARPVQVFAVKVEGFDPAAFAVATPAAAAPTLPPAQAAAPPVAAPPVAAETAPSIAVMPFVNMSQDEEYGYFATGLSEELLTMLAKISGLRVASRTSAFSFKGKDVDIPTVAKSLHVAHVLEGSVRKSGKRVRIVTQLVEAASDSNLWAETYDRDMEDVFAVQDDIAQCVVKELRVALGLGGTRKVDDRVIEAEVHAATKGRSQNVDAYNLYLEGQEYRGRLKREDTAKAVECYLRALQIDPGYALAWAGLSRAYSDQAGQAWVQAAEGFSRAKAAAQRALAREADLAEGHAALGWVQRHFEWDWKGAEASFRRALEAAPGNTLAMNASADMLAALGRFDEAIALARRATSLDPLNIPVHRNLAMYCIAAGQLDEAERVLRQVLQMGAPGLLTFTWLGVIALARGNPEEALELVSQEVSDIFQRVGLCVTYHALGRLTDFDAVLAELIAEHGKDSPYQIAEIHGACGNADQAFEWLDRACVERDPGVSYLRVDPFLPRLHRDARWLPLLRQLGLAD